MAERARRERSGRQPLVAGAPGGRRRAAQGPGPGRRRGAGGGAPAAAAPAARNEWQDWTEYAGSRCPRGQRLFGRTLAAAGSAPASSGPANGPQTEWVGPVLRTEWEAGPFTYPVDVPEGSIEVQDNGEVSVRSEGGRTHVVYGPWQVVIRGIGARAERRVLGTWEYRRQIAVEGGVERGPTTSAAATRPAARSGW